MKVFRLICYCVAVIFAVQTVFASVPGRKNYCVGLMGNYYAQDSFIGGLTGVGMNGDVFDHENDAYALVHCASQTFVVVEQAPRRLDMSDARTLIVEMIAEDRREKFEDVVALLERRGFSARVRNAAQDTCICAGEN